MSEIIILGEERMVDVNIIDKAFAQPEANAEFHWYLLTDHASYFPYLVKVKTIVNDLMTFRGVNLNEPTTDFGPDSANNSLDYEVALGQLKYVYREKPSTLNGIQPSGEKCYALLFLSDAYIAASDTQERLAAAKGGPKWPVGAGSKILALQEELAQTKADFAKKLEDLKAILLQNGVDNQAKVEAAFGKYLP